jgi:hypothetical protein
MAALAFFLPSLNAQEDASLHRPFLFWGEPLFYTFITLCHFFHSLSQQALI